MIAGSEFVRLEREHQHRQSLNNGHASEEMDPELSNHMSAEASINSTLQLFVKLSAEMILDSWSETQRYLYSILLEYFLFEAEFTYGSASVLWFIRITSLSF